MSAGLIRLLLLLVGLACGVLAFGYFTQAPWALATWPWKDGPLANIFVSSVLAAVSAAMLWVAVSGHLAGAAGGFLHVSTMVGGIGLVLLGGAIDAGAGPGAPALLCLVAAATGVVGFAWVRRLRLFDARPLPMALRVWCVIYLLILLPAGSALLLRVPGIMPWPVKPTTSAVYGCVFVAAAWSFAYPLLYPRIEHIRVGLVGFLAYDLVLLPPFFGHFDKVLPELRINLILYVSALIASALVSVHYLLISRDARVGSLAGIGVGRNAA